MTNTPAQSKRADAIARLSTSYNHARTTDDYVRVATEMADAASLGRTDRWKSAARNAGQVILDHANRGLHTEKTCRQAVLQGLELMDKSFK